MVAPRTLLEAVKHFSNRQNCNEFMIAVRWADGKVRCPHCDSDHVVYMASVDRFKCYGKHPRPQFSLKVGTIFEDSPIALEKWLPAVWLLVNCKNGISSYEVARDLGVTQKSAWFMMHRIRLALQAGSFEMLSGEIEVDETYVGGKARNMSKYRKEKKGISQKRSMAGKVAVMGLLDRHGEDGASKVRTMVIDGRRKHQLREPISEHVEAGSTVYTDALRSYNQLADEYTHKVIDHAETYVDGQVHTNGLENYWSLLKRAIKGTYVSVEPFHLFRYLNEQAFRFNERTINDADRFALALSQIVDKRLTYKMLTGKMGEPSPAN